MTGARHSPTAAEAVLHDMAAELRIRVLPWLQTREGLASAGVAAVVLWILWAPVSAPLVADLLCAAFVIVLVCIGARLWESRTAPRPPAFSLAPRFTAGQVVVERDRHAGFWRDNRGFLWDRRVWFAATGCPPCRLRPQTYRRLRGWSEETDLPLFVVRSGDRQFWWWRSAFFSESGDYEPEDLRALLLMLERGDDQGLAWELGLRPTRPIPDAVKRLVFTRDRGRCLVCGSDELIRYSRAAGPRAGGDEPSTIHLLCTGCHRDGRAAPRISPP